MSALTLRKLCMKIIATLISGLVAVSAFAAEPAKAGPETKPAVAVAAPAAVAPVAAPAAPAASAPVVKTEKKAKKAPAKSTAAKDQAAPATPAPASK